MTKAKLTFVLMLFYASAILVQLLVVAKVIPYTSVNGGMSKSYSAQAAQSVLSIGVMIALLQFVLKMVRVKTTPQKWSIRLLYVVTVLWCAGCIMQLFGTNFERYVLTWPLLLGAVSHIVLIRSFQKSQKSAK